MGKGNKSSWWTGDLFTCRQSAACPHMALYAPQKEPRFYIANQQGMGHFAPQRNLLQSG